MTNAKNPPGTLSKMPSPDAPEAAAWSRRHFLQTGGAAAAIAALPEGSLAQNVPTEFDGSKFQLAAPEPNPKRGGVLRAGYFSRQPHFDIHQSGTFANIGTQACQFDNLIRRDPRDSGKTIIPDLAQSWEISKDRMTYTFKLRDGVRFHDGADLTAEDVKATFDRIIKPPTGVSIPRSVLFRAMESVSAPDKSTIIFKMAEARPVDFVMSSIASGWNVILRKKTLEDNQYNLRRAMVVPGTGPYISKNRIENERWQFERNEKYWNTGLPYLDGLEIYHLMPFSPELGSAFISNRVDYVRVTDPGTYRIAKSRPNMSGVDYYQAVVQATWMNNRRKPLDDPRVRRAFHLVLDKGVMVDMVKDLAPMIMGGFIYPFSEWATPKEEMSKRLGYQSDPTAAIKEARALMAAAGYANGFKSLDYMVRDIASWRVWSQGIQAILQQTLNVECKLRTVVESVWFEDAASGNYDLAIGAIVSTLLDPSDYFNAWYGKVGDQFGPQNYSFWDNKEFQAVLLQIDREVDLTKRKALVRKAEDIMEMDPPLLPITWEKIIDLWYNYVKGIRPHDYFGLYDVNRFDVAWLDK